MHHHCKNDPVVGPGALLFLGGGAQWVIVPARAEDFATRFSSVGVVDDQFDRGFGRAIKPHDDPLAKVPSYLIDIPGGI